MKKVLLRLLVAGAILAIIVIVLMNTVFKIDYSVKTHSEIADAVADNGQIAKLSKVLEDEDVINQFPNSVFIIDAEIKSIKSMYPKIQGTTANSDDFTKVMLDNLNAFEKELEEANKFYDRLVNDNPSPEVRARIIGDIGKKFENCIPKLNTLNKSLTEYLLKYYANNLYDTSLTLQYMKSAYLKKYVNSMGKENNENCLNDYKNIVGKINDASVHAILNKDINFNNLMYNCPNVNVYKLIIDAEYGNSLGEEMQSVVESMISCINNLVLGKGE